MKFHGFWSSVWSALSPVGLAVGQWLVHWDPAQPAVLSPLCSQAPAPSGALGAATGTLPLHLPKHRAGEQLRPMTPEILAEHRQECAVFVFEQGTCHGKCQRPWCSG